MFVQYNKWGMRERVGALVAGGRGSGNKEARGCSTTAHLGDIRGAGDVPPIIIEREGRHINVVTGAGASHCTQRTPCKDAYICIHERTIHSLDIRRGHQTYNDSIGD